MHPVSFRNELYSRFYLSTGVADGTEFKAPTFNGGDNAWGPFTGPRIAMNDLGWSVIGWTNHGQDPSPNTNTFGVHAQIYDPQRNPVGPEFRVPTNTGGNQWLNGLVMTPDADVLFTWDSTSPEAVWL